MQARNYRTVDFDSVDGRSTHTIYVYDIDSHNVYDQVTLQPSLLTTMLHQPVYTSLLQNSIWIMNADTARMLPYMNEIGVSNGVDMVDDLMLRKYGFPFMLLGHPVVVEDYMDVWGTGTSIVLANVIDAPAFACVHHTDWPLHLQNFRVIEKMTKRAKAAYALLNIWRQIETQAEQQRESALQFYMATL